MDTIYFNWYELNQRGRKDPAAIIILTHALNFDYNYPIAWSSGKSLLQKLHIHHIPSFLFQTGILEASKVINERPLTTRFVLTAAKVSIEP